MANLINARIGLEQPGRLGRCFYCRVPHDHRRLWLTHEPMVRGYVYTCRPSHAMRRREPPHRDLRWAA